MLLTIGQAVAAVACVVIPMAVLQQLAQLGEAEKFVARARRFDEQGGACAGNALQVSRTGILLAGVLSFCLSAALFVVFKRAKAVAAVAAAQEIENQRLWEAIDALRGTGSRTDSG